MLNLSIISSSLPDNFVRKLLLCVLVLSMLNGWCFGQVPPIFEYDSPQTYDPNVAISPLSPRFFGGDPVPPNIYGTVTTHPPGTPFDAPQALAKDAAGNIYVIETNKKVIWKVKPDGTVSLFAGVLNTAGNANGPFGTATFTSPAAAVFDSHSNMFVSDNVSNTIRKVAPDGTVSTFAGTAGVTGPINGIGAAAQFKSPYGLAIDASDNIYVADMGNNLIRKIAPNSEVTTFSGSGQSGTQDGTATTGRFANPKYIAMDVNNNILYVTGTTNNHIRRVAFNGQINTLAGSGQPSASVPYAFSIAPSGITVAPNGDVFFTNFGENKIMKITTGGKLVVVAGSGSAGAVNAIGTAASFNKPQDLRFDNDGDLYVADQANNLLRKIVLTGYTIDHEPPAGIIFDPRTGEFSGTPTAPSPPSVYTVTGYNAGGPSAPVTINIAVKLPPPVTKPNISYTTPQTYSVGTQITPLKPVNNGGDVPEQTYGESSLYAAGPGYLTNITADRYGGVYATEYNLGRIRKISVTPNEIIAGSAGGAVGYKDGRGDEALFTRPFGIVADANGNLYVAEEGTTSNNDIRKISGTPPYNVTTLITGLKEAQGLAIDPTGSFLYVADRGNNAIKKINLQTDEVTTVPVTTFFRPSGVDVDAQGNLYVADTQNNKIKKISSVGLETTIASQLNNPRETRVDGTGNVYFTDQLDNAVKRIAPDGKITPVISGVNQPIGLSLDGKGNLYVGGIDVNKVYKVSVAGYVIEDKPLPPGLAFDPKTGTFSGTPTATFPATTYNITAYNGAGNSNTTTVTIQVNAGPVAPPAGAPPNISYVSPPDFIVNQPIANLLPINTGGTVPQKIYGESISLPGYYNTTTAVAADATYIYVCDWGGNVIKRINVATNVIDVMAGSGISGSTDGPANTATFTQPDGIITDAAGTIYIADQLSHKIRKISNGVVSTLAGSGNAAFANGTGTAASFNNPRGLTIDASGNIYVADQGNNLIRKITPAGMVTTIGGNNFNSPTGIGIDAAGTLYVADAGSNSIKKITTAGVVTTFATGFNFPRDIKIDGTGYSYVTDQNSKTIKRVTPSGVVTTVLTGLIDPIGLSLDGLGNLYVADGAGSKVVKINVSGYVIDKPLPAGLSFDPKTGSITGTPTVTFPATAYTITAFNAGGSSSTTITIRVTTAPLTPQTITMPATASKIVCDVPFVAGASSTNNTLPITYASDNPAVADVNASTGLITLKGVTGAVNITATQSGNATYADATPKILKLTVSGPIKPALNITDNRATTCIGDLIKFEANVANIGSIVNPTYQWLRNGTPVGTGSSYTAAVAAADQIKCIVTNNDLCTANGENEVTNVTQKAKDQLTLTIETTTTAAVCSGTNITFTAKPNFDNYQNHYQWQINGINAGGDSPTFTSNTFKDGDAVSCTFTNNTAACVINYAATAASKIVRITPLDNPLPSVSITASTEKAYAETPITFTATAINATNNIVYQWQVNGVNAGSNSASFTSKAFKNGDKVTCTVITGNCAPPAISNAVTLNILPPLVITPPNAFTPNGDGINDLWLISGLSTYPNCMVNVYNRFGEKVYQSKGYSQPWDGLYNAKNLPLGTYYYTIDLANGKSKVTGYITIVR
jgi:gliding motility-associated-like protein